VTKTGGGEATFQSELVRLFPQSQMHKNLVLLFHNENTTFVTKDAQVGSDY
jgi:hypothetical protein